MQIVLYSEWNVMLLIFNIIYYFISSYITYQGCV